MVQLDSSTWIAIIAIVVSVLSATAAFWAAYTSQKSLEHARNTYSEQLSLSFAREQSQLLELIAKNQADFEKTRLKIGALKAKFDAAPQPVQTLLQNFIGLFAEYLPRIEGAVRQCAALWDEVANWDERTGIHAIVHHQAKFQALIESDRVAHEQGLAMVGIFEEKLAQAQTSVSDATRDAE